MTYLVMSIVLYVTAVLQVQLPGFAILGGAKMPLLLAVMLYYALTYDTGAMLVAAVCAGFLQDSLSEIPMGYSSLIFCLIGWLVGRFRTYVMSDSVVTSMFFGGVTSLVFTVVIYIWLSSAGLVSYGFGRLFVRYIGVGILGMICTPIVFLLTRRLDQLVGNVELTEDIDVFE